MKNSTNAIFFIFNAKNELILNYFSKKHPKSFKGIGKGKGKLILIIL
jgi:hypothetical protein